jgi:hypothetical protein
MSGNGDDRPRAPLSPPPSLIQGRVTGARHVRDGRVCQDAIGGEVSGGVAVLAVADGHGTSLHGDVGAAIAVAVAVEHLVQFAAALGPERDVRSAHAHARDVLRGQLVREWTTRVRAQAGDDGADLVPYGSTLIFALATSAYLLVGQLGDGDLLLVGSSGLVTRPIAPDPNNFAEETSSLCQKDAWATLRVLTTPAPAPNTLLLLSTDGYSKSYATDAIFEMIAPDYLAMLAEHGPGGVEAQLPEILDQVTVGGSGDDIALGMMYWSGASAEAVGALATPAPELPPTV